MIYLHNQKPIMAHHHFEMSMFFNMEKEKQLFFSKTYKKIKMMFYAKSKTSI